MKRINFNAVVATFFAIALVALTQFLLGSLVDAGTGVVMAVAVIGGQYSTEMQHFRKNLSAKLEKETWIKSKFGQFISILDYDKYKRNGQFTSIKNSPKPSEAIIHLVRDFAGDKRGIEMDVPFLRPITGKGVIGTDSLSGKGEKRMLFNKKVALNMRRHAIMVRDNEMSAQALNHAGLYMELLKNNGPELRDWFSRLLAFEPYYALLYGHSHNLFDGDFGLGSSYSMKSHPNFYIAGYGQVLFETALNSHVAYTFDAYHEENIKTLLSTLTNTSSRYFNSDVVKNMVYLAHKHKIEKVTIGGKKGFMIMIHPAQARQLREDENYLKAMHEAKARGDSNPIFTGELDGTFYEGAWLVVDETIPGIHTNTLASDEWDLDWSTTGATTGVMYHNGDTFLESPRDDSPYKPAILVGPGAIMAANSKDFKLTEEIADHEQQLEMGARMIYGMSRADITDDDNYLGNGAGLFYGNHSSLVYATYSPDTVTI